MTALLCRICKIEQLIDIHIFSFYKPFTRFCLHRWYHTYARMKMKLTLRLKPGQLCQQGTQSEIAVIPALLLVVTLALEDQRKIRPAVVSEHFLSLHARAQKTVHTFQ